MPTCKQAVVTTPRWLNICIALMATAYLCAGNETPHALADNGDGSVVTLVDSGKTWELKLNDEPYFIKGAGGVKHFEALAKAGGNSVRTWGAENAGEVLDRAHASGLTVTVGIWLGHERHGFNYSDQDAVANQLESTKRFVEQYKDHPALLMWGLGNETEGDGNNPLVWKAINDAAKMVKQIDPHHPTMTVIAEIGGQKIENLKAYCPDIDVLGINTYGGLPTLGKRLSEAGMDRPYVVTEYGPLGQWEVGMTPWGVPYEQSSSEKAKFCTEGYTRTIAADKRACLGGYVFHWGAKQEVTPTWYSMFLEESGETTQMVDAMTRFWTGDWPENRAPSVKPIRIMSVDIERVKIGTVCQVTVDAVDPDGDTLAYEWIVQSETTDRRTGGESEQTPPTHPKLILSNDGRHASFKAPENTGAYRLFVYIRDGQGHVATANQPFYTVPN